MKKSNLVFALIFAALPSISFADSAYPVSVSDQQGDGDQVVQSKNTHHDRSGKSAPPSFLTKENGGSGDQAQPIPMGLSSSLADPMLPFSDTRLVLFHYDADLTYAIKCKEGLYTHIEVAQGDVIKGFYLSDSINWKYHISGDKRRLFIKPTVSGQFTAATLVTEKRTYEITLSSVKQNESWYQRVTWSYPSEQTDSGDPLTGNASGIYEEPVQLDSTSKTDLQGDSKTKLRVGPQFDEDLPVGTVDPSKMSFGYTVTGTSAFKPVTVFDDGRFTWLRFDKKMQDMPAIFLLNNEGKAEVLPYTTHGDYILISRLVTGILLKLGNEEVRITKRAQHCGIFGC